MARRTLNRRQLRVEAEEAERAAAAPPAPVAPAEPAVAPKKARASRKPRARKEPPRMRARWGVFDGTMKQVAIFDYNQKAAADQRMAELNVPKAGRYFLQIVKEPMPVVAPEEPPAVKKARPRAAKSRPAS